MLAQLLEMDRAGLESTMRAGHPIDLIELEDTEYRGISLGLPQWVERITWKKFIKTFAVCETGALRGWNVRTVQNGLDAPWRPMTRRGRPITFGHYDVQIDGSGATVLRYRGAYRMLYDPLVSLEANDSTLLLGRVHIELGGFRFATPGYFGLERQGPLTYRAVAGRGA